MAADAANGCTVGGPGRITNIVSLIASLDILKSVSWSTLNYQLNEEACPVNWSRAHWVVGLLTLLIFPLTGQYMRHIVAVPHLESIPRLIFRSRHMLILAAGVANIALSNSEPFHRAQRVASLLIMVSPVLLIAAFFIDPARGLHSSTVFRFAMYSLWIAGVLLAIVNRPRKKSLSTDARLFPATSPKD